VDISFSDDSSRIVTASLDGTARVWDAASGAPLTGLEHLLGVRTARFDPSGRRVVTASFDKTAAIWDVATDDRPLPVWAALAERCTPFKLVDGNLVRRGSASIGCPSAEISPRERLLQAGSLLTAGAGYLPTWPAVAARQFTEALTIYRDSTRADGMRLASWYLAVSASIAGDLPAARTVLGSEGKDSEPGLLTSLAAFAHETMLRPDLALALVERARAISPKDPELLVNHAELLLALGRYSDARAAATAALPYSSPQRRVVLLAIAWASARLAGRPASGGELLSAYRKCAPGSSLDFMFTGTKHALRYGRHDPAEVEPVLKLLEDLEKPIDPKMEIGLNRSPRPSSP
jgi:hypothetical protein